MVKSLAAMAVLVSQALPYTLEGMPGTLFSPSAQPLGHLKLVVSAGAYGHQDASVIRDGLFRQYPSATSTDFDSNLVQDLQSATLRLNASLGLGSRFSLGLSIPASFDFIADTKAEKLSGVGPGDPLLSGLASATLAGRHLLDAALSLNLSLPMKSGKGFLPKQGNYMPDDSVADAPRFFSGHAPGWSARALLTLDLSKIEETPPPFSATLGTGFSHSGIKGTDARFLLGGGLEWMAMPSLSFFINSQTETRLGKLGKPAEIGKEYSFAAAGFAAQSDDGVFFSVNLQKSLPPQRPFRGYAVATDEGRFTYSARYQPRLALAANLGWSGALVASDDDKDGIADKEDLCPKEAEDFDGFQDMDGCPEIDNDGDSIADVMDKCPMEPEDQDGFEDQDGCPELDNDKDGVPDAQDKCPSEPEDVDGFEDYDGCPELDNDKDGVPDAQDKCPGIPEDKDAFEDADGCPEPDNDQDKIPDLNDKCPNEPESYNGFEDGDGCPDMSRSMLNATPLEKRLLLKGVHFQGYTSEMLPESFATLDTLAERIRGTPGVMVEIRGYWDASGEELDGFRNSEARANSVRKYLVSKGVEPNQVLARGMGSREPIANNKTAAGRQQNRRVELRRLN